MFLLLFSILFQSTFASLKDDNVIPTQYKIDVVNLETDFLTQSGTVNNIVTIQLKAIHCTPKDITLDLNDECTVKTVAVSVENRSLNADFVTKIESVVIAIPDSAQKQIQIGNTFTVVIKHSCPVKYSNFGRGLFFEEDKVSNERVIATQFESINARRMFPCFDSPRFKTPFVIRVAKQFLRQGESVYSNGRQNLGKDADEFLEFEKTIPLPTYLVALAIGQFNRTNRITKSGMDIGLIHSPTLYNYTEEALANALSVMERSLNYMAQFTGINYESSKLDMVAVPIWLGMENYGLITMHYNFTFDNSVIAHEVAHMWFGDSTTPVLWDDIWLNEGFATFFSNKSVPNPNEHCRNRGLAQELRNPISVRFPYSNDPHTDLFHNTNNSAQIIYSKGCAILYMLESLFGEKHFQTAIRRYVKQFANSNANSFDFMKILRSTAYDFGLRAFDKVSPAQFLWDFINNRGYPKVFVDYTNDGKAILSQKSSVKGSNDRWHIPIWFSFKGELKGPFWLTPNRKLILGPKEKFLPNENEYAEVIWNPNGLGYYQTIVDGKAEEILESEQLETSSYVYY